MGSRAGLAGGEEAGAEAPSGSQAGVTAAPTPPGSLESHVRRAGQTHGRTSQALPETLSTVHGRPSPMVLMVVEERITKRPACAGFCVGAFCKLNSSSSVLKPWEVVITIPVFS